MTATSCPDDNDLCLLTESRLGEDERRALERHLDECASCSRLVGEIAGLAPPLRGVPERYTVVRRLGAGGMGVVWEAEDRQLLRKVALKWMLPDPAATAGGERAVSARLYREARALAQLRHPNVLAVYDVGEVGDEVFLALELVEGATARAWRDSAPRTSDEILAVWRQVGAGLAAVHRAGIVHRDVKPDNVLVAADGRVLLGDFGLATARDDDAATALTVTGQVLGTPLYMAPEQLLGDPATAKSDQFALSVCLWEALAGARPFTGATTAALAVAILRSPSVPDHVDRRQFAVLARGLAAEPAARWPDVGALLDALAAPPGSRRRVAIGISALAVLAAAGAMWYANRGPEPEALPVAVSSPPATSVDDAGPVTLDAARPVTLDAAAEPARVAQAGDAAPPIAPVRDMIRPHSPPIRTSRPRSAAPSSATVTPAIAPATPTGSGSAISSPSGRPAHEVYFDAIALVNKGEGACKQAFARFDALAVPLAIALPQLPARDDSLQRARCELLAGNCTAGALAIEARLTSEGLSTATIADEVAGEVRRLCPTSIGTWQERLSRLQVQAPRFGSLARLKRELNNAEAVVRDANGAMTYLQLIDLSNAMANLEEGFARHAGHCADARRARRLASWDPLMMTDALRKCLYGTDP